MPATWLWRLGIVLCAGIVLASTGAAYAAQVHRCVMNGKVTYSDAPCPTANATPGQASPSGGTVPQSTAITTATKPDSFYGSWTGQAQYQATANGQRLESAHAVVNLVLTVAPDGKKAEITRLVDAIARFGMSEALESRLRAAERERDALRTVRRADAGSSRPSPETVATAYRRVVMDLKTCLEGDATRARAALQKLLGEIRVFAHGDEVWAEVETRADRLLLEAVGAGVSNRGCGGRI